jgi:hypothetical protein
MTTSPKPVVSRETLEALAEAVEKYERLVDDIPTEEPEGKALASALAAYRAEATPQLRTLAEVDAEIVRHVRICYDTGHLAWLGEDLKALCAERVAPEPEKPPGNPVVRIQWQCSSCGWGFFGPHQKTCPGCGVDDYWCGSVAPDCKPWPGYPCAPAPGCKAAPLRTT